MDRRLLDHFTCDNGASGSRLDAPELWCGEVDEEQQQQQQKERQYGASDGRLAVDGDKLPFLRYLFKPVVSFFTHLQGEIMQIYSCIRSDLT